MIEDALLNVQNESFRKIFRGFYNELYLSKEKPELFKAMLNENNPLLELIELSKKSEHRSKLIHDLIQTVCDQIEVSKEELSDALFNEPTKETFVYTVLFEDSFDDTSIRNELIKELMAMWENWEQNGCQVAETQTWNRMKDKQRKFTCDVWNRIGKLTGKEISFQSFITGANNKVQTILKVKEDVKICVTFYCRNASDLEEYLTLIKSIDGCAGDSVE